MFERKLRPRPRPRACLLERRWTPSSSSFLGMRAEFGRLENGSPSPSSSELVHGSLEPAGNEEQRMGTSPGVDDAFVSNSQSRASLIALCCRACGWSKHPPSNPWPQVRQDHPLNLSILLSGGKETNKDSLSSGERRGKSPAPNPRPLSRGEGIVAYGRPLSRRGPGV